MQSQKTSPSPQPSTDFGAGGRILQDIGDLLKVVVSGGDPVHIVDMYNEPARWKDSGGGSP